MPAILPSGLREIVPWDEKTRRPCHHPPKTPSVCPACLEYPSGLGLEEAWKRPGEGLGLEGLTAAEMAASDLHQSGGLRKASCIMDAG